MKFWMRNPLKSCPITYRKDFHFKFSEIPSCPNGRYEHERVDESYRSITPKKIMKIEKIMICLSILVDVIKKQ